ncbi:hypothetical protein [Bacillus sp. ISL-37]|jgi:hypothetical protein|uniref:hypothetical protein n=1 Tax=Bacillus sp. ISL-37 TaxID=2819123 RepID=UPI001BE6AC3E|nr:hypothetical protein [Bacillus sp. ISL-37]
MEKGIEFSADTLSPFLKSFKSRNFAAPKIDACRFLLGDDSDGKEIICWFYG